MYATKDLHFAAYLKIKGMVLVKLERRDSEFKDRRPVYFVFEDREACQKLEYSFWNDEAEMVNLRDYLESLRSLRARISTT